MNSASLIRSLLLFVAAGTLVSAQSSFGALLLNYQFESVDGIAPDQTTPDSSGNFTSTVGTINALLGFGANTPGTDYPQQVTGPVGNAMVQSLNQANGMQFYGGSGSSFTRVQIDDSASAALDAAFTNFSVALWLNPNDNANDRFAIGKIGTSNQRGWQIYSPSGTNSLVLDYFATNANGTDRSFLLADALPPNTWTHVAFAFDGTAGTEAMYINGVAQLLTNIGTLASVPATLNGANNQPFRVGHRGAASASVFAWSGGIDDVRIYDETLTATQVQALTTPVPEPCSLALAAIAIGGIACYRRWW